MTVHTCTKTSIDDCELCLADARAAAWRMICATRGRYLVVFEGGAIRCSSRRRARGHVRWGREEGIPVRVIRYRRDRVRYDEEALELKVTDPRWWP